MNNKITLMLVHPGFAGAKLVDGSVSCERAELMAGMGANVFVGGTAGVYRKGMELSESIPLLRAAISR